MRILSILLAGLFIFLPNISQAQSITDSDMDGLSNWDEEYVYYTDPINPDTDGDGYVDGVEVQFHYSPHGRGLRLSDHDLDGDGLSDWLELQFGSDWNNADSDGDGFDDFMEINNGFDPNTPGAARLSQRIVVNTKTQKVAAYLGGVQLTEFDTSTGKPGYETPPGTYQIENKHPRAWSGSYGLWMPYWMGFIGTTYGIHELPEWPGGYKEGQNHLGIPVSHGCVRLGVGDAGWLYNWAQIGATVEVL